jgi:hypothetical protein
MTGRQVPARTKWGVREMRERLDAIQIASFDAQASGLTGAAFMREALADAVAMLDAGLAARARQRLLGQIRMLDEALSVANSRQG